MNTPCGQYLVKWLTATKLFKAQGAPSAQMLAVKKMLYELWFELYHRGGGGRADDSCAFEHVFVGEVGQTKDRTGKEVKGSKLHTSSLRSVAFGTRMSDRYRGHVRFTVHNWINIYAEEKAGKLDYKGYIKPRRRGRGRG
jgi:poly(U)-specific endoribonuclease